ncbi:hypothetical protein [Alicyclobacillus sacchari]|uniref:hypothetical protein n=1 Tax=Alicyclobacillus sacchari TaxID=392010 RepID=UPI0024E1310D|nr:hypothetical protein [Alicyclobacillus sacchari]
MPTLISFGAIYTNTPQQNAGVFIGETNITTGTHMRSRTAAMVPCLVPEMRSSPD